MDSSPDRRSPRNRQAPRATDRRKQLQYIRIATESAIDGLLLGCFGVWLAWVVATWADAAFTPHPALGATRAGVVHE